VFFPQPAICRLFESKDVYRLRYTPKKGLLERLSESAALTFESTALRLVRLLDLGRYGR